METKVSQNTPISVRCVKVKNVFRKVEKKPQKQTKRGNRREPIISTCHLGHIIHQLTLSFFMCPEPNCALIIATYFKKMFINALLDPRVSPPLHLSTIMNQSTTLSSHPLTHFDRSRFPYLPLYLGVGSCPHLANSDLPFYLYPQPRPTDLSIFQCLLPASRH